jgi:DNA-binding MarR family transcriptional regulator
MLQEGWIAERRGKDRRERLLRLSKAGEALLGRAQPAWDKVQARLRRKLGEQTWNDLAAWTDQVTTIALQESR